MNCKCGHSESIHIFGGNGCDYIDCFCDGFRQENDPVSPSHYKFPGGAEVIQISQHLTSLGGQALQYVARATRLDGNNKENPVEDLRKAIFFLNAEIERLSG